MNVFYVISQNGEEAVPNPCMKLGEGTPSSKDYYISDYETATELGKFKTRQEAMDVMECIAHHACDDRLARPCYVSKCMKGEEGYWK